MLADSCEAAVRSLSEPTRDEVAEMVRRIVQGKMDEGQLKQSPLTLEEINKIERSFLVTFSGLLHERIRYPELEPLS
ncbi:Cyclic-di-AMP phosphodiesterase PgpH [bioreactor metagenome]|uniref:Cyclic-di-AMP phosphodiesterase PgpH n=1 Tax=bioreactor metagenome TaxID=1076179 RepID=A0A645JLZ0_9ZZZZ